MRSPIRPLLVLLALLMPTVSRAQIVVNEIMYVPNAPEPEWIEVYNTSDTAVPIAGWSVQDRTSARPTIPAGIVPPKSYLVLARDTVAFRTARPAASFFPLVQVAIPSLNNTGDDIILRDASGRTVDSVSWSSSWGGTGGVSLERITAAHAANERDSWKSAIDSTGATPGRRNSVAPAARDLSVRPLSFDPDTRQVTVVIGNAGTERSVGATASLYFDNNNDGIGTPDEAQSGKSVPQIEPGDSLSVALPWVRPLTVHGEPGLLVLDHPGDEQPADNSATVQVREKFVDTGIVINEFIYAPAAPEPEWVELQNRGSYPVELTGWTLHDAGAGRPKIGAAIILPGGYLVLTRDTAELRDARETDASLLQFSLPSLNNTGDNIVLRNRAGAVVDSVGYRSAWGGSNGRSVERRMPETDGTDSAAWGSSIDPAGATPGKKNSLVPPQTNLALGAARFDPDKSEASVTVINTGREPLRGALVLYRDANENGAGEANEENARVELPFLDPLDSATILFLWSFPLTLGGETGLLLLQTPGDERPGDDTARFTARLPTVDTGLIVNEIMYDPNDPEPEWVEVHNRGTRPVDLAGWRIADASGSSGPLPSAILLPGDYAVITPDTVLLRSLRSVPSRLVRLLLPAFNNSGDGVTLRNPSGAAVDSFRYAAGWGGREGVSLERKAFDLPSTDPASWTSATNEAGGTPGAKNSWQPILYDLAVGTVAFDADASRVTAVVVNNGLNTPLFAEVALGFDADGSGRPDPGEELQRVLLSPPPAPGDSGTITLEWPRPLTTEGEEGWIEIALEEDQQPQNNRGNFRAAFPPVDTGLIVNEIMYDPTSPEPEWLEVYNRGTLPVRLKGWKIRDGSTSSAELPEFTLPPGDYAVITSDSAELRRLRDVPAAVLQLLHPLFNNGGDRVLLSNPSGKSVDEFAYTSAWGGKGGKSLERTAPGAAGNDPQSWKTSTDTSGATPGRANSAQLPQKNIALRSLSFDPTSGTVFAIVGNTGDEPTAGGEIILYHDTDGDALASDAEELSRNPIPSLLPLDSVTLALRWPRPLTARGERGIVFLKEEGDANAQDNTGLFTARLPLADGGVVVNEFMYAPAAPEPEWIEVLNSGTLPVDFTGWSIGDAGSIRILPEAVAEPGDYVVLTVDTAAFLALRERPATLLQVSLPALNNSEDAVVLRNSSGNTVDSVYYFASWGGGVGRSLERRRPTAGRIDSASWRDCVDPAKGTPGRANSVLPPSRNLALDSVGFNPASRTVAAAVRNGGNEEIADGELVLYYDRNEDGAGTTEEEIGRVALPALMPDSTTRQEIAWPRLLTDEGETALAEVPAPGDLLEEDNRKGILLRRTPPDSGLAISEIMFDPLPFGEAAEAEYVEVYNLLNRPVPLASWRVADGSGKERIVPEPAPFIAPGSYGVIAADSAIYLRFPFLLDSSNVVVLGTDLGLNNTEDDVVLRNPTGRTIDSIRYSGDRHWKELDDTKGIALERLALAGEGNDPHNWSSSVAQYGGTPGAPNSRAVPVEASSALLSAAPPRVSPDGDGFEDFTRISYRLPTDAARVVFGVYDRHGRRVARPVNNAPSAAEGSFIWDGTDDDGRPLPIGIYLVRMEAYAADGAGTKTAQTVITVARRL